MSLKTKVEPIADWVSVVVKQDLAPEAKQRAIATFARDRLSDAQQINQRALGHIPPHETFVDGRKGAALETVNPTRGTIIFEFELVQDVLIWIMQTLVERSPRRSGAYIAGHRLFADGREVAGEVPGASEYSFTNTVPYARKIEIGRTKTGRDFVIQVPNRIYERTAQDAQSRFGNIAKVSFTFRGIVGGAQISQGKAASSGQPWWLGGGAARAATGSLEVATAKRHGRTAHNKSNVRYPTIVVTPN